MAQGMQNKAGGVWTIAGLLVLGLVLVMVSGISQAAAASSKVICTVETDRAVLPAGESQDVVLKVTLDAPPVPAGTRRPKVNLALVLDRSGSMTGTKMAQAKAAAVEALTRLGSRDVFSVVVYDTNVHTIVPAQNAGYADHIVRTIDNIQAGGNTALFGGVSQGAAEIRKHLENDFIHRIVLLSDGLANVGPRMPEDLGRLGAALLKENISVTTVGVGTDYNEDLMARLAQNSDGNTYFVESGVDLPRIFAAELGDVLNVVATQVNVTITLPGTVQPVEIIGRQGRITGQRIELFMNQLYGDQQKYALVKVRLPAAREGDRLTIARAEVLYQNPLTRQPERSGGTSLVSFSHDPGQVKTSVNPEVVREYQLNLKALAQEKAIELSDGGRQPEAVTALKQSAESLRQAGRLYDDSELLKEADAVESQADQIEEKGMSKKSRKILRTQSYQQKNQQVSQ